MPLFEQIAFGVYVGALTGVFTGFLSFLLAFGFQYVAGVKLADRVALFIGLGVAGLQGSHLLRNPEFLRSPTVLSALLVVLMLTLFAHEKGDELGQRLPKGTLTRRLWRRTLSSEAIERIGRFGQVRVRTVGEVNDIEGYPPLPEGTRAAIAGGEWTFPADLPLSELEARLADSLRTEHDLAAVRVAIDAAARATVAAAPESGALSRRLPADRRAVTVAARLPAGLARGDEVELGVDGEWVGGSVLGVTAPRAEPAGDADADAAGEGTPDPAPAADPERRRATVAVGTTDVGALMDGEVSTVLARSRGGGPEFELVSLLRSGGDRFRKLTVRRDSAADGTTLAELDLRARHGVDVLALRRDGEWTFAPGGTVALRADDDLFAAGPRDGVEALGEVVA